MMSGFQAAPIINGILTYIKFMHISFLLFCHQLAVALLVAKLVPNDSSDSAASYNAATLVQAFESFLVQSKGNEIERIVEIGTGTFYVQGPIVISQVSNITVKLSGSIQFTSSVASYPFINGAYPHLWTLDGCNDWNWIGLGGSIDGYKRSVSLIKL